jgi:hypothetical protein
MRPPARMRGDARRRLRVLICAYVQRTRDHMRAGHASLAFIASRVACVPRPRRKRQAVATNPRARACSPSAVWIDALPCVSACIRSNGTFMRMLAVRAHAAAGSCCGLSIALHTLGSASSVRVAAQSIYSHARVFTDRRLPYGSPVGLVGTSGLASAHALV